MPEGSRALAVAVRALREREARGGEGSKCLAGGRERRGNPGLGSNDRRMFTLHEVVVHLGVFLFTGGTQLLDKHGFLGF